MNTPTSHIDRLVMTLFLAVTLHTAIILGLGFELPIPKPRSAAERTLEIIVVQKADKPKPVEKPDFLAQSSQEGSGEAQKPVAPEAPAQLPPPLKVVEMPPLDTPPAAPPPKPPAKKTLVTRKAPEKKPMARPDPTPPIEEKKRPSAAQLMASASREIQRLSNDLDRTIQAQATRLRRKQINASTQEYLYSNYLAAWARKVERIGNLNYPEEAKQQKLYGSLLLRVSVRADGSIEKIRLLRSSGQKLLDDAAIRIVQLAAPFAPFPAEIREETDILEITRTWQFQSSNRLGMNK